jgi:uncharacterized iron-regulated protein
MVVSLTNTTDLSSGETRVYNEMTKINVKRETQKEAARLLISIFKTHSMGKKVKKIKKKHILNEMMMSKFGMLSRMKKDLTKFKKAFKKLESYNSSEEDSLIKMNEKGTKMIEKIHNLFDKTKSIERKCRRLNFDQLEIIERVDELLVFQTCIANFLLKFNAKFKEVEI